MLDEKGRALLESCAAVLRETSLDMSGGGAYMTGSELTVYDFDQVKEKYIAGMELCESPASCDALYLRGDRQWYLIEFKNGGIDTARNAQIKQKILESLLLLLDIAGETIAFSRRAVNFILVYNEDARHTSRHYNPPDFVPESQSRTRIGAMVSRLAAKPFVRFDLQRYEGLYFREVRTYDKAEFEQKFASRFAPGEGCGAGRRGSQDVCL